MKLISLTLAALVTLFSSCRQNTLVKPEDYNAYLPATGTHHHLDSINREISFWAKRFDASPDDIIARSKIAGLYNRKFMYSGDMTDIMKADSLYQLVNALNRTQSSGTFRSMAALSITRHQFRRAQSYIDSALELGDDRYQSLLMDFDAALELGAKDRAWSDLNKLSDKNSFEYLIRLSKYKDHAEGDIDEAVRLLEQALNKARELSSADLELWTLSNLGDLYSHQGSFGKAYQCYLEVIQQNPEYYHVWKGIAWLAFSHDHQTGEAKRILQYLKSVHPLPDYDRILYLIADFEKNPEDQQRYRDSFLSKTANVMYGDMYNKYRFNLMANIKSAKQASLALAIRETGNRPTPEAYSWLAWAYLLNGEKEKAVDIAGRFVENRCFEPDALSYLGYIYLENGNKQKAKKYLSEAASGGFELGPVEKNQLQKTLDRL